MKCAALVLVLAASACSERAPSEPPPAAPPPAAVAVAPPAAVAVAPPAVSAAPVEPSVAATVVLRARDRRQVGAAVAAVRRRLAALGLAEAGVTARGAEIVVELRGAAATVERARDVVVRAGRLEIHRVVPDDPAMARIHARTVAAPADGVVARTDVWERSTASSIASPYLEAPDDGTGRGRARLEAYLAAVGRADRSLRPGAGRSVVVQRVVGAGGAGRPAFRTHVIEDAVVLASTDLAGAAALGTDLSLAMTPAGATRLAALSAAVVGRRLAILLDGEVIAVPLVMTPVEGAELLVAGDRDPAATDLAAVRAAVLAAPLPTALEPVDAAAAPR